MPAPIDVSVEIKATPETVWQMLTENHELERWFPYAADVKPEEGGRFHVEFIHESEPDMNHHRTGEYREIVPRKKLVHTWVLPLDGKDVETVVTITLEPHGDSTTVRLIHDGWPEHEEGRKSREGHNQGWGFFWDNIKSVLEEDKDLRLGNDWKVKR